MVKKLFLPVLLLYLSLSLASAQTLVAGKIYNSDYSDIISDASISVICGASSLNTLSLNDGTYAVRFDVGSCDIGETVKVSANKGELSGESSGSVTTCDDDKPCSDSDYVAILNLNIKTKTSSGGGSGGFYLCGNGRCDSGENENTCPKDCKTVNTTQTTATITQTITQNETAGQEEATTITEQEENKGFLSRITGAVIGGGNASIMIALLFIILIFSIAITIYFRRKSPEQIIPEQSIS